MSPLRVVASYGRLAGSARVRAFDWLDWIGIDADEVTYTDRARLGIRDLAGSPIRTLRSEWNLRTMDERRSRVLFLSRRASPFSNGRLEARLLRAAGHGVYDFDDALWLHRRRVGSVVNTWRRSVEAADIVIAGNEVLANEARAYSENVVMIPSCVDPTAYTPKYEYNFRVPIAGWIGSPTTEKYLLSIADPLLQLNRDFGLRVRVISAGRADLGSINGIVDRIQWSPSGYADALAAVDVGIMPLDDTEWSRGKCAYKLLQYGAAGLVAVATPVGANRLALERMGGVAASSESEWYEGIRRVLMMAAEDRRAAGEGARTAVGTHYSFEAWRDTWLQAVFGRGLPAYLGGGTRTR